MGITIDIIILAIIALSVFLGYKQGLVKVAIKLVSFLIAIIIAFMLYKPATNFIIQNTQIDDKIENSIIEKITPAGLSKEDKVTSNVNISTKIADITDNSIENISNQLTTKLIEAISLFLIFIVTKIVLKFITILADSIAKLPILKQFNKIGGIVYGLLRGLIIVYTILGVALLCEPLIGTEVSGLLQNSIVSKSIYDNNILIMIFL